MTHISSFHKCIEGANVTMRSMLKSLVFKQMLKKQLAQMPEDQREKLEKLIDENPEIILELAQDVQKEMEGGKDQMSALQSVAEKNKEKLKGIM